MMSIIRLTAIFASSVVTSWYFTRPTLQKQHKHPSDVFLDLTALICPCNPIWMLVYL